MLQKRLSPSLGHQGSGLAETEHAQTSSPHFHEPALIPLNQLLGDTQPPPTDGLVTTGLGRSPSGTGLIETTTRLGVSSLFYGICHAVS